MTEGIYLQPWTSEDSRMTAWSIIIEFVSRQRYNLSSKQNSIHYQQMHFSLSMCLCMCVWDGLMIHLQHHNSCFYLHYMPCLQQKNITMKDAVLYPMARCCCDVTQSLRIHTGPHLELSSTKRSATYIAFCWLSITTAITPSPMPLVSWLLLSSLQTDYQSIMLKKKKKSTSSSLSSV